MTHRHPRVVYWNNQPTPYVVARFNAVVRHTAIDLEAWFDVERESDRSWDIDPSEWAFAHRYLPHRRVGGRTIPLPGRDLLTDPPDLLVVVVDRAVGALGALLGRSWAERVATRTLPAYDTWTFPLLSWEAANHVLYRGVDGAKVPGADGRAMAGRYGLPADRTWEVTQSIDVGHYGAGRTMTDAARREHRRANGYADGDSVFLYVGRLWSGKGLDWMIRAFDRAYEEHPGIRLALIGNGPDEDRLRAMEAQRPWMRIEGFVQPASLPEWYGAADALVFPTLGDPNGLVVEEAMAAGLPVIASTSAGDIRHRIDEGRTGFVVPTFDTDSLAARVGELAGAPDRRRAIGAAAARHTERFSVEAYAHDFERFVDEVLTRPPRRGPAAAVTGLAGRALLLASRRAWA